MQVHARLRSRHGTPAGEVRARTLRALAVMGLWRVRNTQVCPPKNIVVFLGEFGSLWQRMQRANACVHAACFSCLALEHQLRK